MIFGPPSLAKTRPGAAVTSRFPHVFVERRVDRQGLKQTGFSCALNRGFWQGAIGSYSLYAVGQTPHKPPFNSGIPDTQ